MPRSSFQVKAFKQLALANWRAIVRDRRTLFYSLFFPLSFFAFFAFAGVVLSSSDVQVVLLADDEVLATAIEAEARNNVSVHIVDVAPLDRLMDVETLIAPVDSVVAVSVSDAGVPEALALVDGPQSSGDKVRSLLVRAGLQRDQITLSAPNGDELFDPLRFGLPSVLVLAMSSLALFGTAIPMITLRQRGTLRLLAVTPASRLTFLLAQGPARLVIGAIQLVILGIAAVMASFLEPRAVGLLAVSAMLGLTMTLSFGFLVGSFARNMELATGGLGALLPLVLFLSGVLLPLAALPDQVGTIARFSPFSYLGDVLSRDLVGLDSRYHRLMSYGVMISSTVLATLAAVRLFRWDQGER